MACWGRGRAWQEESINAGNFLAKSKLSGEGDGVMSGLSEKASRQQ